MGNEWIMDKIIDNNYNIPSGKLSHSELERSTMLNGQTHDFDWAIFNSFLYVYQRVTPRTRMFMVDIWVCLKMVLLIIIPMKNG